MHLMSAQVLIEAHLGGLLGQNLKHATRMLLPTACKTLKRYQLSSRFGASTPYLILYS